MDEYLKALEVFYDEKMKYLSHKDKYISCNRCSSNRVFKENNQEIVLSCGSGKDDECGDQIIIKLPKYTHYDKKLDKLKKDLNDDYNWDTLQKIPGLDVSEKAEESKINKERIDAKIENIEKMFVEKNTLIKQEELQEFYNRRIKDTKECKEKAKLLQKEKDETIRKELRKEYVKLVMKLNKDYKEIQEKVKDVGNDPFLLKKEPKVEEKYDTFMKKTKKKSSEKQDNKYLIDQLINAFIRNEGILTRVEFLTIKKGFKLKWGNELFRHLLNQLDHGYKKKEQNKIGPIINNPGTKNPDRIQLTDNWRKYLLKEFEIGMRVSWVLKGKSRYGTIQEIEGKKITVIPDKGKEPLKKERRLLCMEIDLD